MTNRTDTSLGGPFRSFPATTWGFISGLAGASPKDISPAVETLCTRYWKPVYTYIRVAWGKSNEESKDLAQSFFLWLLEGDAIRKFAPDRGGFRAYLKTLLRRFVGHQETADHRLKRGGGARLLSLEGDLPDARNLPAGIRPDEAFDQSWMTTVMEHAVASVRAKLDAEGRQLAFRVFETHDLARSETPPSYAEVGAALGISETQVRDHLAAVRRDIRSAARAELSALTADDDELGSEWNELFGD